MAFMRSVVGLTDLCLLGRQILLATCGWGASTSQSTSSPSSTLCVALLVLGSLAFLGILYPGGNLCVLIATLGVELSFLQPCLAGTQLPKLPNPPHVSVEGLIAVLVDFVDLCCTCRAPPLLLVPVYGVSRWREKFTLAYM